MPREPGFFEDTAAPEERTPEIHLAEYWAVLVKYRRLILVCVAVALLCSVGLSFLQWESAVVVSGVLGMSAGYACKRLGVGQA